MFSFFDDRKENNLHVHTENRNYSARLVQSKLEVTNKYVRKLSSKSELFWIIVFENKIFHYLPFDEDLSLNLYKLGFP
jgi:hypothetical protein